MTYPVVKAAAVQAEPVWFDAPGGIEKTIATIDDAGRHNVQVIAFPELFIAGYPWQIWHGSLDYTKDFVGRYHAASIERTGPELRAVGAAAKRNNMAVVLGFSEYDRGSLYIAQAIFAETGELVGVRRKLKPTGSERTVFGDGSGADLQVHELGVGRVGALSCWEHIQPLTKYTLFSMGEQIHAASWPNQSSYSRLAASSTPEGTDAFNLTYAVEGQVFVLESLNVILDAGLELFHHDETSRHHLTRGGGSSSIWAPDGSRLASASALDAEELVIADLDFARIEAARSAADPVGHYSRPDIFTLHVNFAPAQHVVRHYAGERVDPTGTNGIDTTTAERVRSDDSTTLSA